jgi:hypothetical protein
VGIELGAEDKGCRERGDVRSDGAWTPLFLWGACNGAGPRRAIRV